MKYIVAINGKNYEVEVEKGQASIVKTTANVLQVISAPVQPAKQPEPAASGAVVHTEGEVLKAPMPGTILDVKQKQGASVKKGDILLILEAMKMENEITAPRDGIVAQMLAAKGATVATGDALAVLQ